MENTSDSDILFSVETPLNFSVRTTVEYWNFITTIKHPIMKGKDVDVQKTLASPDEIRRSKIDENVFLFYREDGEKRWVCAVARQLEEDGFLITAYRTSAIKEGVVVWQT
ncbi:DUF4258 domain-containing protein [Spirulina sp.]|uniref:DUF4258 domain-containing protein n=1 Tax=Spirulina sp. TaxID=1157 RepID=UPI003F7305B5